MPASDAVPPDTADALLAAARLASLIESSEDAILSKKLDGTIVTWNRAAERMFGYSAAEMVGSSVYILVPPELHHEEQGILNRIAKGERVARYETTRIRKGGEPISVELTVSPVRDLTGVVIGASSIVRDAEERQRAAETAARLAAIVEFSDDAILSKTLDGTITSWNRAAELIFGYPAKEMIGKPIFTIIPEALRGEEKQILSRVARGEHVAHYETVRLRKDGFEIQVALTLSPIRDRTGSIIGVSSINRDVSERRRNEEVLRGAAKMEAVGRLAAGLAHDFNNQLHAVSGFASFAARDPGLGEDARSDLEQIQKAAERMASLTRQLLAFARQQVLSLETLDLVAAVTDAHTMVQRLIGSETPIQLVLGRGPYWVQVDRAQLVQVLMNLVINARDAISKGGRIVIRAAVREVQPGESLDRLGLPIPAGSYAELAVIDSGTGIAAEHLTHIFDPFYTTKEIGRGTGLGLSTVDGIVSQSGGRIQVESAVGEGTTIRILLPLAPPPKPASPEPPSQARRALPGKRVLVVDDEELVRSIVTRTLLSAGYEVLTATNGREALDAIEHAARPIDLVIADLVMPVLGGAELAEELDRRHPEIALIWISGHPRDMQLPSSSAATDHAFLQKPIPPELLLETIDRVLQREATESNP